MGKPLATMDLLITSHARGNTRSAKFRKRRSVLIKVATSRLARAR
jgi:hypothetical protein